MQSVQEVLEDFLFTRFVVTSNLQVHKIFTINKRVHEKYHLNIPREINRKSPSALTCVFAQLMNLRLF